MELSRVHIKNFRSIKDSIIQFDNNCLVLLGKNEAGKSNVLKAIASVFDEYEVSNKDKRKKIANEKITEYCVRVFLKFSDYEFQTIKSNFEKKFTNSNLIKFKSNKTLLDFFKTVFFEVMIKINIADDEASKLTYWSYKKSDFEIHDQLFVNLNNELSKEIGTKEFDLFNEAYITVRTFYNNRSFRCNYWQYEQGYLLPNSVSISNFINNPNDYKALENIFTLCKRDDIKKEFEDTINEDGDYINLLEQVSKEVTAVFQKIWKDFKDTSIELIPNGDEILIKVCNKTKYSFEDRSDGFKKFISILLMLSTQSRSNKIHERDIILIDEPDQSLYPTSASFLKDELLEISKKSKVIYSTHSQYMIDSNNLDRHLIVEKKDDITTITKEDKNAPFSKDELLRRAIGSGVFECLQPINIIFEGWLDKELFVKHNSFHKKTNDFKNIGITYLGGISGAESLISLLLLANKKFIVVADSDEVSKNKRIDFEKNYPSFKNNWIGYTDLDKSYSTMEDFFTVDYIQKNILELNADFKYEDKKDAIFNIEKSVSKDKEKKQQIKNSLIKGLKKEDIKEEYNSLIELIKGKIKSL